jgi:hypothetical protein
LFDAGFAHFDGLSHFEVVLNLKSHITAYYIINPLFSEFSNKTTRAGVTIVSILGEKGKEETTQVGFCHLWIQQLSSM